jgi:hypothetical protein
MILVHVILLLVVAPVLLIVVGSAWLWLGHKLLKFLLGGCC